MLSFALLVMLASAKFSSYYCKTCTLLILRIATSGFLTALECTKFVFGWGCAPDLAGGAYSAPQTPCWFKEDPTSVLRKTGGGGMGGERTPPSLMQIPGSAPVITAVKPPARVSL